MTMIADNLQAVQARIALAASKAGRQVSEVQLLAVSKTFGVEAVHEAYRAGQRAFGENYIQEGIDKIHRASTMGLTGLEWHCIGPIQSNKTRLVAENFDWVHSIDRLKTAQRLSEQRPASMAALQVCIQVNIDGGINKGGVAPAEALTLAQAVRNLPGLSLRGIMTLPELATDFEAACALHIRAKNLFDVINSKGMGLDTLSMGMTSDLEAAVHCGSTMVRLGTAVFGGRSFAV